MAHISEVSETTTTDLESIAAALEPLKNRVDSVYRSQAP
jgi:hypothetical protein